MSIFRNRFPYRMLIALLILTCSALAAAQSGRGTMNGIVLIDTETQGIAGAVVELTGDPANPRLKGIKLVTATDNLGRYSFKAIPYGVYTFRVSLPGYRDYLIPLYIPSDAQTQIHVRLEKEKKLPEKP
jgi:hypothetical protein